MKRFAAVIAAVLGAALPVGALAAETPTANGTLTVGDKTFILNHVYAQAEDDVEGIRLGGPQKTAVVLLADTDVAPGDTGDWFHLATLARAGKLHAIQLRFDPAKRELINVTVFYLATPEAASPLNITLSGTGNNHHVRDLTLTPTLVSGVAEMAKAEEWHEIPDPGTPKQYNYKITFHAPLQPALPVTANLAGKVAQDSAQATAALKFFTAVRAADFATVRTVSDPNPEMEAMYKKLGAAKFKEAAAQMTPDPKTFRKSVKKVVVRAGSSATIIFGSGDAIHLIREGERWKVAK